ncbi:hypothetical protein A8C32_09350 [Flavivirga aquatica]|uniref:Transposase DDE domain-containing protein n=1 Tax=Flavivirga aquatica TaxID=1849968 RepID=A0A1E5SJX3_9FLAO|nr:IS1380 family transposase [Flavivirga aquatica]OEJ99356.1 hypothetical protein A8C32_09350 [Flavivirga aquatica]
MKILNSTHISPFGGLNFVLEEFENKKIGDLLKEYLPLLPNQCKYSWKDLLFSFWSIYFCGGDCIEDLAGNFHHHLKSNRFLKVPSPDRILDRFKELSKNKVLLKSPRGKRIHEFSMNQDLNRLNLKILTILNALSTKELTLDYDNTLIFNNKADSANTYKKEYGYCLGVGIIGNNVVYLENRNGNSNPRTLQEETLCRMFYLLDEQDIKIKAFRADSASYLYKVLCLVEQKSDYFYIKARMNAAVARAINDIQHWEKIETATETIYRGEIQYKPFIKTHRESKSKKPLKTHRLIVSKIERNDKQINLFTNEAYLYSAILTNDNQKSCDDVVYFYNQRGTIEKEFDVLKNDFGWKNLPFSKLEQNTVFMIFTAICRNLYHHIITLFSEKYKFLKANFRIKKFIFRFITVPAKWIKTSRQYKLRIYGNIHFKT